MIDIETLDLLAKKFEIDTFSILREILQVQFVDRLYKDKSLKNTFFKGGTCLRLILGSTRFSEDLDFTTDLSLSAISQALDRVVLSISGDFPGLFIKKLDTRQGLSFKLFFQNEISTQPLTIKLDFSLRESILDPVVSPMVTELPVSTTALVEHLSEREILAEKIRAILTREKGRDIFDLWFLLSKGIDIDKDFVNQKLKYYDEKFDSKKLMTRIENQNEKKISNDLNKFLPFPQRKIIGELKRLVASKIGI